jgi:hypothetical protein
MSGATRLELTEQEQADLQEVYNNQVIHALDANRHMRSRHEQAERMAKLLNTGTDVMHDIVRARGIDPVDYQTELREEDGRVALWITHRDDLPQ